MRYASTKTYGYTFKKMVKPNGEDTRYIKILKYIGANPGCTRKEVIFNCFEGRFTSVNTVCRGFYSSAFAAMRRAGLFYSENGKYFAKLF